MKRHNKHLKKPKSLVLTFIATALDEIQAIINNHMEAFVLLELEILLSHFQHNRINFNGRNSGLTEKTIALKNILKKGPKPTVKRHEESCKGRRLPNR